MKPPRASYADEVTEALHRPRLLGLMATGCLFLFSTACSGDEVRPPSGHRGIDPASGSGPAAVFQDSMAVFPLTITDGSGQLQVFREPPRRILSLVPSATQTLQALGSSHLLVGRTDYDTATSLAHLPSVGGGLDPNLEAILVLEPDLILGFAGESDTSTPQRLAEVGIQHLSLRLDRMADVRTLVEDLGSLTGQGARAGFLLAEMDSTLTEIRRRVGNSTPKRVAYVLGGSPPWVAGPGTFIDELLTVAGGTNVFSDLGELYGPVSMEEFLVREMDIVLAPQGVNVEFPNLELPLTRVSPALELPGPELGNAAWELARALHPEVFR